MSELSKQALKVDNNTSFPNNNSGLITPQILRDFNNNMIDSLVDEIGYTADSASWNQQINALEVFTASAVTSAITASSLVTASFDNATRNLTFTKGNNTTFAVNIPDASGSAGNFVTTASFNSYTSSNDQKVNSLISATGSYATTGSNTFNGVQTIRAATGQPLIVDHNDATPTQNTLIGIFKSGSAEWSVGNLGADDSFVVYNPNTFQTPLSIRQDNGVTLLGSLTASLQQGYAWVGNGSNVSSLVATSSFGTSINTGSFATTGSNVFTGDQTLTDSSGNTVTLSDVSGSLMLIAKSYTSASAHISSSVNQVNLIWKQNDNTADTIISGSGNIFANQSAPTAGFKRYIGGNFNTFAGIASVPQISGSMAFSPTMATNYIAGGFNMRGPVSSSTWSINQNNIAGTVNIGSSGVANAEKLTSGLTLTGNNIGGTLNIIANQTALTGSTTTLSNNIIAGTTNILTNQSAVILNNNIINDAGFQLTNNYFSASAGLGQVAFSRNNVGGQANQLFVTGSNPTGTTTATSFSDNLIAGGSNLIYGDISNARVSGSFAYHNAIRNMVVGNQLIITGSSLLADASSFGSAFIGRYNAIDGTKDMTAETIFAVGTGNSTTRKTGFLIDSGSNTFIEGTLNVSGSSSFTGAVNITGSLLVNGASLVINTGSFATTGSNTFVGDQTVNADLIVSASKALRFGGNGDIQTSTGNSVTQFNASYGLYMRNFTSGEYQIEQVASGAALRIRNSNGGLIQISGSSTTIQGVDFIPFSSSLNSRINSFATTGSNAFFGTNSFSGAVSFTGSAPTILSSSFSGSLITNLTDTYVDVPAVQQIVTLTSASYAGLVTAGTLNPNTLYVVSGSEATINTGSLMLTGSVAGNILTFTKADSSTFSLTVATGSGGSGAGFPYTGDAVITGSLLVSGSSIPDVRVIGNIDLTGSMRVQPVTLSVTSLTASIDMNTSNYFILNLPTSSTTHVAFTNIIPGESINLLVSQSATAATGSIAFAPNIYFPGGNDYVATATGSAKDIVSFITFNSSEIYATNVKNLK